MTPFPPALPRIETAIARAHRALAAARDDASTLADLGLHDDLQLMLLELERMQHGLLRPGKYRGGRCQPYVSER
jgi:hypothetical protein